MQVIETRYYCDYCGKSLRDKQHISIHICHYAGVVKPPEWKHKKRLEDRPYQFCDIDNCLTGFLFNNAKKDKKHGKTKTK